MNAEVTIASLLIAYRSRFIVFQLADCFSILLRT